MSQDERANEGDDTEQLKRYAIRCFMAVQGQLDQAAEVNKDLDILNAVPLLIATIRTIVTAFPDADGTFIVAALAYRWGILNSGELAAVDLGYFARVGEEYERPDDPEPRKRIGEAIRDVIVNLKYPPKGLLLDEEELRADPQVAAVEDLRAAMRHVGERMKRRLWGKDL